MAGANRAALLPLIPRVLADVPAQRAAAERREARAAFVRDFFTVRRTPHPAPPRPAVPPPV